MSHSRPGPELPRAPESLPPDVQKAWNGLVHALRLHFKKIPYGYAGNGYVVSGTTTATGALDLANPQVTATTQTLAKLLSDLSHHGIIILEN